MFPLVHYYINKNVYESSSKLMILGGLWPDLASGAGLNRNEAHAMGDNFYNWCQENAEEALPLARGIIGHGIQPFCVDYYADENWHNGSKGWCFQMGKPYEAAVSAATGLGSDYAWWKSHNFVEICCEIITNQRYTGLGEDILDAILDQKATKTASRVLSAYSGCDPEAVVNTFQRGAKIFALTDLSTSNLAEKQKTSIIHRVKSDPGCNIPAMAALLEQMQEDIEKEYEPFMGELLSLCATVMSQYR